MCIVQRELVIKTFLIIFKTLNLGRSGSYAAIEMALYEICTKANLYLNMIELANKLRSQRERAIQTDIQFVFVHRMILQVLEKEKHIELTPELISFYKDYDELIFRKKKEMKEK